MGKKQSLIHLQIGGWEAGEQPWEKESGGFGWQQAKYESTMCPDSQLGQPYHGVQD